MKHALQISVSKKPANGGAVSVRRVSMILDRYYLLDREVVLMTKSQMIKDLANGSIDTQTSIGRIIPAEYYPYIAKCNIDMGMIIQSGEI